MNNNNPTCPKCGSGKTYKKGFRKTNTGNKQRYKCHSCSYLFTLNPERRNNQTVINEEERPEIIGVLARERVNIDEIYPYLEKVGERAKEKNRIEDNQSIRMPNKPFMVALLSDIHGGAKSDYEAIKRDVELIKSDPDIYAILAGDLTDNFIIGKLQSIQREQSTTFDMETRFLIWFIKSISESLIAVVSGNHDNWTRRMSGIDEMRNLLRNTLCLYDTQQSLFTIEWSGHKSKVLVRHRYKHGSIFNPTHGMEVFWERGGLDFDIAIGGHTHIATLCRPFIKHDKKRYAILLGTYKLRDDYAKEIGVARTHSDSRGSGALVFLPDYDVPIWFDNLVIARNFLDFVRNNS